MPFSESRSAVARVLLIGSGNRDKALELRLLLAGTDWDVRSIADYAEVEEPVEDVDTFDGNAMLKAKYYGELFNVACVSDDSGIEVDALDGEPGVYSARYAGEVCTYADNNRKLLEALSGVEDGKRGARFVCCAAYLSEDGRSHTEFGEVRGKIIRESRGESGFGYDPVFIPEGSELTFGEMAPSEKKTLSHRGEAFRKMRAFLESGQA